MKNKLVITALIAATLAAQGSAFADDHRDDHRRGPPHRSSHSDNRFHDKHYDRGAGPHHDFRRGGYISREYRSRQYVVNDWRGHRLHQPPRGYHWVQTGTDYVLIAVATGVIAQIVLGGN